MQREIIFAANWKMNKTISEAFQLANSLKRVLLEMKECRIVVCPPFTALSSVRDAILDTEINLGAQNIYWEESGAYTGEVSAAMAADSGCEYVIVGHSERRKYFHEDDKSVNNKLKAALKNGLSAIFCIGETLEERKANKTIPLIESQMLGGLEGILAAEIKNIIIAYEPVWAIGTGVNATPQQAEEVHAFIRAKISKLYGPNVSDHISILYGGSVKPDNIDMLMAEVDIDGVLVGGASLKAEDFIQIVNGGLSAKNKGR